jgi:hypothetical protein
MGGDGTTAVASLRSIVSAAQKEEKEDDRQRGTNRDKEKRFEGGGAFWKWEIEAFQFHFNIKRCCW